MRLGSFLFQNRPVTNVHVHWFNKVMSESCVTDVRIK